MVATFAVSIGAYVWSQLDSRPPATRADWVQLTRFSDSAVHPALSPDGRLLAFIRGADTFTSRGQIYLKLLPSGEPVALTHDNLRKMSPVFSPDGARIAYTVSSEERTWDTWAVPTLHGEPYTWLRNASGLTWIGPSEILFSEIKKNQGVHMGIVTSAETRLSSRDLYLPSDPGGMAHRSFRSPDGRSILIVEMDAPGKWLSCRLAPFDGSSTGRPVGPRDARCTSAGWSPDGRWMYFSASVGDAFHIWRQRFPDGPVEQTTSGPTQEEGVAVAPDGRSLVTSVGFRQRSVWLHDRAGERQISGEGYAYAPLLSADGEKACYLITNSDSTVGTPGELWVVELRSGRAQRILPGQMVTSFDLSRDDRIAASVVESDGKTRVWLTSLDGRTTPRRVPTAEGEDPRFGTTDEIIFHASGGAPRPVFRVHEDGSGRQLLHLGGRTLGSVSPDGQWLSGVTGTSTSSLSAVGGTFTSPPTWAFSLSGAGPVRIFSGGFDTRLRWAPDGSRVYLSLRAGDGSAFANGRTYVLPFSRGSMLPQMPAQGFQSEAEVAAVPGVEVIPYGDVGPGSSPEIYVFSRENVSRNLYRIPLP
jgi:eukaryotic-like serine/threonine-protein kinase